MRALVLMGVGGTDLLQVMETPAPEPREGEILIQVAAASVNYADILIRLGSYPLPPELPAILGMEVAGDVVDTSHGTGFAPGDRVMALTLPGRGFAEFAAVPAATTFPLPEAMSYRDGAAFLLTFLSAYVPLTHQLRVQPGQTLLVHGSAGGVGTAAVQLGRHLGARVIATASSAAKLAVAAELGAAVTIDYATEDVVERVRAATSGAGVDSVLDPVGGEIFRRSIEVVRPLGAVAAIGFAAGRWDPVDPALLVGRNIGIHGFYLARLAKRQPSAVRGAVAALVELWERGAIQPYVGAEFRLEQSAEAHALVEERRSVGKVVVRL
jgi:NADPH2:quinone reductase